MTSQPNPSEARIRADAGVVTVINAFTVDPSRQQHLIELCGGGGLRRRRRQRAGQVPAGLDIELAVHATEVDLDRLHSHKQRLCDLLVADVLGGHLRDPALARGQRLQAAEHDLARVRPGCRQLLVALVDKSRRPALMRKVDPFAQVRARLSATVGAAQRGAEIDQGSGVLQPRGRLGQHLDRFPQHLFSGHAAFDPPEGPERDSDRLRGSPPTRKIELLPGHFACLAGSPEAVQGERSVRAPGTERGVLDSQ
jgi:hypothetical protein